MEIYKNVSLNNSNSSRGSPGKGVGLTRQNSILTDDFSECWPCHIQRPITWEVFMSSHWNFQDKEQKKGYLRNYRICNEIIFILSAVELSLNLPIFLGVLELPRLTIHITYDHVLYPEVPIEDLKLCMEDCQWLSEIGLTMTGWPWK